jgi:hypothetical protein
MRRFCWACLALIVVEGCKPGLPKDIVQPDKMNAVLYDIHMADGYITTIPNQDSAKKISAAYYKGIYKKFGIDSVMYTRSMNYYYDHPDLMANMYTTITKRLEKTKDSLNKIQEKRLKKLAAEQIKKDSIDKADPRLKLKAEALRKDSLVRVKRILDIQAKAARKDSLLKAKKVVRKKVVSVKKVK